MPYKLHERYHANVLAVKGRFLGSIEREGMQRTFDLLKANGQTHLVVDLSATDFMDSTAVGLLVNGAKVMREAGGDVCLAGMQTRIANLFAMTRLLGNVFTDYPTVDEALQSFVPPQSNPTDA
ncbi:MAG TPA: STAS domain-containing protein [Rhodothermales bacterium]|nr:STAS domain-containing protein [Rhodothermales bacterium]